MRESRPGVARPRVTATPASPASRIQTLTGDPSFMTSFARGLAVIQAFSRGERATHGRVSRQSNRPPSRRRPPLRLHSAQIGIRRLRRWPSFLSAPQRPLSGALVHLLDASGERSAADPGTSEQRSPGILFGCGARRNRDRLCRPVRGDQDHGGRFARREPPARVLHFDGTCVAGASSAQRTRCLPVASCPDTLHGTHRPFTREASARPPRRGKKWICLGGSRTGSWPAFTGGACS